jgi:hypothetical protein
MDSKMYCCYKIVDWKINGDLDFTYVTELLQK